MTIDTKALLEGEWWHAVVRGPNPTSFSTERTEEIRDLARDNIALREALADLMSYHDVPGPVDAPLRPLLAAGFAILKQSEPSK